VRKRTGEELVENSEKIPVFSVYNQVKIKSQDKRGRESLAQYILRSHFLWRK